MTKIERHFARLLAGMRIDADPSPDHRQRLRLQMLEAFQEADLQDQASDFQEVVAGLSLDAKPRPAHRQRLRRRMLDAFHQAGPEPQSRSLEGAVANVEIDDEPSPEHREHLRRRMLDAMERPEPVPRRSRSRRQHARLPIAGILRSKNLRFAAAAVVIIGIAGLLIHLSVTPAAASTSFAEVLKRVREATNVSYTQIVQIGDHPPGTKRIMLDEAGRMRIAHPNGKFQVNDTMAGKILLFKPAETKALVLNLSVRGRRTDLLERIRSLGEDSGQFMGTELKAGRPANVFRVRDESQDMTLWADSDTNLPIHVEIDVKAGNKEIIPTLASKWTLTNFAWNRKLDKSLFSVTPPKGYSVREKDLDGTPREDDVIQLLRYLAKLPEKDRPDKLDMNAVDEMLRRLNRSEATSIRLGGRPGSPPDLSISVTSSKAPSMTEKQEREILRVLRGLRLVRFLLRQKRDWHFSRPALDAADKDTPICWWRAKEGGPYRVVYGDMSIRDVDRDKLPMSMPASKANPAP